MKNQQQIINNLLKNNNVEFNEGLVKERKEEHYFNNWLKHRFDKEEQTEKYKEVQEEILKEVFK